MVTLLGVSCTDEAGDMNAVPDGTVRLALMTRTPDGSSDAGESIQLKELTAYRFEDGTLREVLNLSLPDGEGMTSCLQDRCEECFTCWPMGERHLPDGIP